jgi:hypothetical protein
MHILFSHSSCLHYFILYSFIYNQFEVSLVADLSTKWGQCHAAGVGSEVYYLKALGPC